MCTANKNDPAVGMGETRANESAYPGCGKVTSVSAEVDSSGLVFPVHLKKMRSGLL